MPHRVDAPAPLHPLACNCRRCEPDAPSVPHVAESIISVFRWTALGMAIGWAVVFVLDRLTNGPGMLVGFGL